MDKSKELADKLASWPGITAHPHRFGGTEFKLGTVEIGHIHGGGLVDIPFTRKIKDQLLGEGKAMAHHILPDSGWISFFVRTDEDIDRAIWLLRLSYLHKIAARRHTTMPRKIDVNVSDELSHFDISASLRQLVERGSGVDYD